MTLIEELKDRAARERLANAMFNLVKKPTGGLRLLFA